MKKLYFIACLLIFTSCAKKITLSDGDRVKTIYVEGQIKSDIIDGKKVIRFKSLEGTRYTINSDEYSFYIK